MLERRCNGVLELSFGVSEFAGPLNESNFAYLVLTSATYGLDRRHYSLARLAMFSQCCHPLLAQAIDSSGTYLYASRWTRRCSVLHSPYLKLVLTFSNLSVQRFDSTRWVPHSPTGNRQAGLSLYRCGPQRPNSTSTRSRTWLDGLSL